jgi:hypothetical protein
LPQQVKDERSVETISHGPPRFPTRWARSAVSSEIQRLAFDEGLVKQRLVARCWNNVSKGDDETKVQEVLVGTKRVVGVQGSVGHKKSAAVFDSLGTARTLVSKSKQRHLKQGQESKNHLKIDPQQLAQTIFG